jgi:hypothetical protein
VRGDELEKALSFAKRELEQLQRTAEAEAVRVRCVLLGGRFD